LIQLDPAVERWNRMREDTYKNFKWNNRTARAAIIGMAIVPGVVYYIATKTDRRYSWAGTRKGEHLDQKM
ncbi:hypothetical protein SCHPADRAFT_836826, partial [Schizopora paradoxa]